MNQKNQKGITLIALVITIIVLLILAGVTINMVLGEDGIIKQAQDATQKHEEKSKQEDAAVKIAEAATSEYESGLTNGNVITKSESQITEATDGVLAEIKMMKKGGTGANKNDEIAIPIPKGFAYLEGETVEEGIVVVDKYGNEFVWVPVDEVLEEGAEYDYIGINEKVSLVPTESDYYYSNIDNEKGLNAEQLEEDYFEMVASVTKYKGFYVGRYETSWTGTRVASVANVLPMDTNTPLDSIRICTGSTDEYREAKGSDWYTFYNKQKALHEGSLSVVSGMIYGSQWSAIMDWFDMVIDSETFTFLVEGSITQAGFETSGNKTGSNAAYAIKNIFDLAGNNAEWTNQYDGGYMYRYFRGHSGPLGAEWRLSCYPNNPYEGLSSRLQLYIK